MKPHISVVVPTSGRPKLLAKAVSSVITQNFDSNRFEIVIVENGEKQGVEAATRGLIGAAYSADMRYVFEPQGGLLAGRHRGFIEAQNDILVFVDDDIEADRGWLSAIADPFRDPSVQLVGGRNLPAYETEPPGWLGAFWTSTGIGGVACSHLSLSDLGDVPRDIDPNYIWGLNFAIRRSALVDLGGFHPDAVPPHLLHFRGDGETGLTVKAKERAFRAVYAPGAVVRHFVPKERMTEDYFEKRSFIQGISDSYTAIRRLGGLSATAVDPPRERPEARLWRYARNPVTHARRFIERKRRELLRPEARAGSTLAQPKHSQLGERMSAAHRAGFGFHQTAVRRTPGLLDWVLRKNYWDYAIPELSLDVRPSSYWPALGCETRT